MSVLHSINKSVLAGNYHLFTISHIHVTLHLLDLDIGQVKEIDAILGCVNNHMCCIVAFPTVSAQESDKYECLMGTSNAENMRFITTPYEID